ncbi:MAG: cell division protein SepF [Clostridia bacterium]|nr:cell division protein SepF [Clostridia bacterium]
MAGKFYRILDILGLTEESDPQDSSLEEYGSGSYGRPSTYIPQRSQNAKPRRTAMNSRQSLPAQSSASRRSTAPARRTYGEDERTASTARRSTAPSRFEEPPRASAIEREPQTRSSSGQTRRTSSRFEEPAPPRVEQEPPRRQPARATGSTVVLNLVTLRDANKVIASLVRGNTIVMTLETDDPMMRQRIVDTLSGAVYALDATIRRASDQTYLLAPRTVDVQAAYDLDEQF